LPPRYTFGGKVIKIIMWKTVFILIILMTFASCISAQRQKTLKPVEPKQDSTIMSVTYDVYYQRVLEVPKKEKDIMRLDIGTHSSQYVSPINEWIKENGFIPGSPNSYNNPYTRQGYTSMRNWVFKNTPKQGYQYFTHDPGWISTRDRTDSLFTWILLEGDSIVCDYPCKKAQTTFRGRTWTVWYTLDLPYSDGPWKFCGLPGLVLHAYESEGYFRFNCIGIEKGDGHEIKLRTPKSGVLDVYTHERAAELMMLEQWDMFAFHNAISPAIFSNTTILYIKDPQGKVYKPGELSPQTAILYEKFPGVNVKKKYPQKKKASKKK